MLPGAGIDGEVLPPEESLPRAPVLAVPLPWAPGRLCPRLNAYGTADSKQNSFAEYDATISHCTRSGGLDTRVGVQPVCAVPAVIDSGHFRLRNTVRIGLRNSPIATISPTYEF